MSEDEKSEWASTGWTCPSCGAAMPDGAVICISCGFDKRTGRRINEPPPSRLGYHIATTVAAIGLALAARYYFMKPPPPPPPKPATPAAVQAPAPVSPPLHTPAPTSAPAVAVVATNPAPLPVAPQIDSNEVARLAQLAELARTEERKEQIRVQFDAKAPLFVAGEDVALRMTNAIVRRGTFRRISDTSVVLAVSSNEEVVVSFEALDLNSRLRCDAEFRVKYMDYLAERAAKMEK